MKGKKNLHQMVIKFSDECHVSMSKLTTRVKELNYEEDSILQIIFPANNNIVMYTLI